MKENSLKVDFEGKTYSAIPRLLAVKIISNLPNVSSQPIFKTLHRQLLKVSLESELVLDQLAEECAEDYRKDSLFWSQKLKELSSLPYREITVPAHPGMEISEDGEYYNHEALGYIMVDQIANPHRAELGGEKARANLQKMLEFHQREREYNFFLYQVLTGDINTCLLAQTMLADWIRHLCEQQQP